MAELRKMSARHKISGPSSRPIGDAYSAGLNVRRRTVTTITGLLRLLRALLPTPNLHIVHLAQKNAFNKNMFSQQQKTFFSTLFFSKSFGHKWILIKKNSV